MQCARLPGIDVASAGRGGDQVKRKVNDVDYLTREQALDRLGIKRESLYTYASRGLLKTLRPPGSRRKLYLKSDVEKLKSRAGERLVRAPVSQHLRYGEPIVQTLISEIRPEGPRYRGYPALELADQSRSFEYVADLIWTGKPKPRDVAWSLPTPAAEVDDCVTAARRLYGRSKMRNSRTRDGWSDSSWIPALLVMLALRQQEHERTAGAGAQGEDAVSTGRSLVAAFAGVAGILSGNSYSALRAGEFISECLLRGFGCSIEGPGVDALNRALTLSAEHELSAPTFAARICASTGADLAASVACAVLVQTGPMQAGGAAEVEELFAAVLKDPGEWPAGYTARDLPCFSHPLYDRDPRANLLIQTARDLLPQRAKAARVFDFVDRIEQGQGRHPNIFAALVMLCMALELPNGSAAFLHTLGRIAGWIAHAAEQRLSGVMLRPRARYVGTRVA